MQAREAKQLSLPQLLAMLGHQPVRTSHHKLWYCSPLRKESKPSFCVEPGRQVAWIFSDHGTNLKGNILGFVTQYKQCSISEALAWLEQVFTTDGSSTAPHHQCYELASRPIQICSVKPIQHPALLSYLKERAIEIELARRYLRELHYKNSSQHYFALGWKTDLGGWSLRAKNFKASVRPAGITTIGTAKQCLAVFEGIFDFLSALSHYQVMEAKGQVVILNSVNHTHMVARKIQHGSYQCVRLYLDNDSAGRQATQQLLTLANTVDCSELFSHAKDFAEWYEAAVKEKAIFLSPANNL